MAELREQLSVVAERVRRRSTGRSERMTIKNKIMKVLLINGSPRKQGNTFLALSEVASDLRPISSRSARKPCRAASPATNAASSAAASFGTNCTIRCTENWPERTVLSSVHRPTTPARTVPCARFWTGSSTRQGSCSASSRQQP